MYRTSGRPVSKAVVLLAGLAMISLAAGAVADQGTDEDRQRMRRTPAVEIFQTWRDSVVFVTGPRGRPRNAPAGRVLRPCKEEAEIPAWAEGS